MAHKKTAPGRAVKAIDKVLHDTGIIGQPGRKGLLIPKLKKIKKTGLPKLQKRTEGKFIHAGSAAVSGPPVSVSSVLSGQTSQEREKKATGSR